MHEAIGVPADLAQPFERQAGAFFAKSAGKARRSFSRDKNGIRGIENFRAKLQAGIVWLRGRGVVFAREIVAGEKPPVHGTSSPNGEQDEYTGTGQREIESRVHGRMVLARLVRAALNCRRVPARSA